MEELEFITTTKSAQFYHKGQTIYQQGSQAQGMHCIHQGKVKLVKAGGDGKEHITRLVRHGDALGFRALLGGGYYTSSAIALDDCVICFIPRPDVLRLVQSNRQFANTLLQLLANGLGQAEEQMLRLAYKPVRERLAEALLLVRRTFDSVAAPAEPYTLALSREDLAALVGTAKETVSRLLTEYKDAGVVATRGSLIMLLDEAQLQAISTRYD
ncbi:Crp/Fnr family transcriptional regulator [Hymenobacter ginsengisoli]|uniref:Crp/Fnr family transcriptional regulator n=1 Tax=Hymenobacter ginsengisoli TaxID=1051626 RepID=A0ABP8QH24_9BACT|nr:MULTISPECIES: Crp/Fnr family transcriptional regulator [unclassified Hymenobacter]MBO2033223.1 Crp/Fnr family transcriptional regulator [Hymenobacter sp. BT559]